MEKTRKNLDAIQWVNDWANCDTALPWNAAQQLKEKLYIHLRCISRVMPSEKNPIPKCCVIDDSMHVIFWNNNITEMENGLVITRAKEGLPW